MKANTDDYRENRMSPLQKDNVRHTIQKAAVGVCAYMWVLNCTQYTGEVNQMTASLVYRRYSFDSLNSSSSISGHCCKLVLDENSFTVTLLPGRCFTQRKDRMFFASSTYLFGQHVLSEYDVDKVWLSPVFFYPII